MLGRKKRNWEQAVAKVHSESTCRFCGLNTFQLAEHQLRLETVHLVPRQYDPLNEDGETWVDPDTVVAACGPATSSASCHSRFDRGYLDVLCWLTRAEQAAVVRAVGLERADVRLTRRVEA